MSSGPTGWLPLVLTTFGAGAAGSLIATYGGQARERRKAQSEVMACLQRLEIARANLTASERFNYDEKDMAELSARCVLAGVPQYLVSLYQLANDAPRYQKPDDSRGGSFLKKDLDEARFQLAYALMDDAAALLGRAIWHPWLSMLFRRRRARKVRDLIARVFPHETYRGRTWTAFLLSEWEQADAAWAEWRDASAQIGQGKDPPEDEPQHD
jgi:hypothetical protein